MWKEEDYLLYFITAFLTAEYIWELYLAIRQHCIYTKAVAVPTELNGIMTPEVYRKARIYGLDKSCFGIVKSIFSFTISMGFIYVDGFITFWKMGKSALVAVGYTKDSEVLQSASFLLITNIFNTIVHLPFSIYYTFVLEERHGFNKQTAGFFIKDKIKSFIVSQIIMVPLTSLMIMIVHYGGKYFFFYLWVFAMLTTFFLLTIYPNYIAPLFDKYTPLPEGELRTRIEQLAASLEFPLYKLLVVEGSKRSSHSNAYFYGIFKNKRIVLFDTLIKDYKAESQEVKENVSKAGEKKGCDNDEVLAILGHELGHWKLNHTVKNIIILQVNLFFMFLVFGLLFEYEPMYKAFGFHQEKPVLVGLLIVFQFIFGPYNTIMSFLLTILSRSFEFQADAFAKQLGKGGYLKRALIKLNEDNLSFPVYDWLYSAWHHSHPPLLERLKAIDKTD